MLRRIIFVILLCVISSAYHTQNHHHFAEHFYENNDEINDHRDDYEDFEDGPNMDFDLKHKTKHITNDNKRAAELMKYTSRHEVTENIVDIPNPTSIPGPIVTNYTIVTPLNNVTKNNESTSNLDKDYYKNKYFRLLQSIQREKAKVVQNTHSDGEPNIVLKSIKDYFNNIRAAFRIKDYWNNLKEGFINGINVLVDKNIVDSHGVEAPVVFYYNIYSKGREVVNNIHNTIQNIKTNKDIKS